MVDFELTIDNTSEYDCVKYTNPAVLHKPSMGFFINPATLLIAFSNLIRFGRRTTLYGWFICRSSRLMICFTLYTSSDVL
nr:hypothetical protein NNONMNKP_00020 [Oryctes rhinoceros nudivirus]